eukprot:CAMPEP_0172498652 /NCGR_PEP_ID=MMETSP1066-20121228/115292_1 /TAXON_ID=671091 /ORGANISM="Coscinodiscus wailesii, Strain CCMP2513" /LENGTH=251 /DNA_ID=CAMNT_0013272017 /DNA_START=78 /DNA_END=833 /DNA_ORIENTATION=+
MASIFKTVTDRVLEAGERIVNRIDEGYDLLFGNASFGINQQSSGTTGQKDTLSPPPETDFLDLDNDDTNFESPLNGMTEDVLKDIFSKNVGPQTAREHFDAFKTAINWSEPFVLGLICFDLAVICATVAAIMSGNFNFRVFLLVTICGVVYSAEWFNSYGRGNWESFASQDYFDKQGVFIGIMLCAPLLVCSFCMLVSFIRESFKLLVQVKRMEIEAKKKRKDKSNEKTSSKGADTTKGNPKKKKKTKKED